MYLKYNIFNDDQNRKVIKMISFIRGILDYVSENYIIVEAGGIGYKIFVSSSVLGRLPQTGKEVKVYTFMSVKEDGISLFGFNSNEELDIFNKLLTVGGVGPKGALAIVSALSPKDIIMAVVTGDVNAVSKAPGVGKKTAQRIILELKDKFKTEDMFAGGEDYTEDIISASVSDDPKYETIEALMSLGYMRAEAVKAVSAVYEKGMEAEELLKKALKKMI